MFGFHGPELIIVLVIALLIFGPKKLPEMGSSIGKSIKEFRKGMSELSGQKEGEEPKTPTALSYEAIERETASPAVPAAPVAPVVPTSETSTVERSID